MVNQVDGDDGGADQAHAVDQAAFRQARNNALCNHTPVRLGQDHGDNEQNAHGNDKELAYHLEELRRAENNRCAGNQTDDQTGDCYRNAGQISQTVCGADLVTRHEAQTGEENCQTHENGDKILPCLAFTHAHCGLNDTVSAVCSDTGGNIHQNDGCNAGEHNCPQQGILKVRTGNGGGGDGARSDKRTCDNRGRTHVLEFLNERFLFHFTHPSLYYFVE